MGKINLLSTLMLIFIFIGCSNPAEGQEFKDKQTKELNFTGETKVFVIKNIFGDVNVDGINTTNGQLAISKTLKANTDEDLAKAKKEVEIRVRKFGDTLLVYIYSPDIELNTRDGRFNYRMDNYREDYEFHFDLAAKVPKNIEVIAETINNGDVFINNIQGKLKAHNVNGSVKAENVVDVASIITVNGDVEVGFSKNPSRNCKFKTINGDIKVYCPKDLSAAINYKSMNGELFTNYEITSVKSEVSKEEKRKGKSIFYKLGSRPHFRIGAGEIKMTFETLNGDMIVKYL